MRTWSRNPGAGNRARYELTRDPARSDEVIAPLARCTPMTVHTIRRELEDAGAIPRIPVSGRTPRPRPVQPSRTRDAITRLGPQATPRQVADLAGVSIQAAWKALRDMRDRARRLPAQLQRGTCATGPAGHGWWDSADPGQQQAAARMCAASCPVLNACVIWSASLPSSDPGIWGGFTPAQRERLARAAAAPRNPRPHISAWLPRV